ncbi:O-antigen ligase family protein [Curtobacterium pusillum]|uniref:O-antigen ligase family protein n=1 Tax=Curtobacterium pusillum TaxID=69373 RepID=UPI0011A14E7C|nr:O-antigen ligase family protein [Curtobacterium pusillum]
MTADALTVIAGFCGLAMVVALALLPPQHCRIVAVVVSFGAVCMFGSNRTPTALWTAVALGCPVLLVVAWYRAGLVVRQVSATMGAATTFLAIVLLSSALSGGGSPAFVPIAVMLGWTVTQLDRRERVAVIRSIIVIGVAEFAYAAAQAVIGLQPIWGRVASQGIDNPFAEGIDRVQASFGQAIVYGFFSAVIAFLAWSDAARLHRGLRPVVFCVLLGGLFLSGTRSALVALVGAIAVHALMRPGLLRWVRNLAIALIGVALVGLLDFGVRALATEALDSGSWLQRLGSVNSVPRLLSRTGHDFWFGSGFGSDQELYRTGLLTSPYHFTVVDNFYVYALGTMGVVGLAALLVPLVVGFVTTGRTGRGTIVVLAVMCAAFDLLAWRSTAAVFVLLLVIDPAHGVMLRLRTDDATGEVAQRPGTPASRHARPRTRRSAPLDDLARTEPLARTSPTWSVPSPRTAKPAMPFRPAVATVSDDVQSRPEKRRHGYPT